MQGLAWNVNLRERLGVRKGSVIHEGEKLHKTVKIRHGFSLQAMGNFTATLMLSKHSRLK